MTPKISTLIMMLLLLLAARGLAAQPGRVEVFGNIGVRGVGGDESSPGTVAEYGGAIRASLARRWAVELDVTTGDKEDTDRSPAETFRFRQTLIAPSILYRRGTDRAQAYFGGGAGAEIYNSSSQFVNPDGSISGSEFRETGPFVHLRGGVVIAAAGPLLLRLSGVAGWSDRTVAIPTLSLVFSVGYRFGRVD